MVVLVLLEDLNINLDVLLWVQHRVDGGSCYILT